MHTVDAGCHVNAILRAGASAPDRRAMRRVLRPTAYALDNAGMTSTRFVLIQPSHAGNVGAAARALKVMGFDDLVLVQPRWDDVLSREEAIDRASGASDVLRRARAVDTVDEALQGMTHVCATVM